MISGTRQLAPVSGVGNRRQKMVSVSLTLVPTPPLAPQIQRFFYCHYVLYKFTYLIQFLLPDHVQRTSLSFVVFI